MAFMESYPKPDKVYNSTDLVPIDASTCVYAWVRGKEFLYVGISDSVLRRIVGHNVIGKAEPVLESDRFYVWSFKTWNEASLLEAKLLADHPTKYSFRRSQRGKDLPCLFCKKPFARSRWWQKYCSNNCRQGIERTI